MICALRLPFALLIGGCLLGGTGTAGASEGSSLEESVAALPSVAARSSVAASRRDRPSRHDFKVMQPLAALPPEAGPVQGIQGRDYADGLRQDVMLGGSAFAPVRNGVTVLVRTSDIPTLDERVPLSRPAEAGIRSEIGGQFPRVAMQVVERDMANAYGPYGLALGRVGADVRCIYMWQWIDANRLPGEAGFAGPVSLRVRLCQAGTSFDAMASLTDRLVMGAAPAAAAAGSLELVAAPAAEARPVILRSKNRRARVRHFAQSHQRDRAALHDPVVAPLEPTAAPGEPRYLTAAAPRKAGGSPAAPQPPMTPTAFAADLPPQALLGPRAGATVGSPAASTQASPTEAHP